VQSSQGPVTQFEGGVAITLPVSNPAYAGVKNGMETWVVTTQNLTCVENSTVPLNIANITFECPDENGAVPNMTCNGLDNYTATLTCESVSTAVATCVFWDDEQGFWSDEGCVLNDSVNGSLACTCYHATDYVAKFSSVGKSFLGTVNHITKLTADDALAILPALLFLCLIVGVHIFFIVGAMAATKVRERNRILLEMTNLSTAVLFQYTLQRESIAQYLVSVSSPSPPFFFLSLSPPPSLLPSLSPQFSPRGAQECSDVMRNAPPTTTTHTRAKLAELHKNTDNETFLVTHEEANRGLQNKNFHGGRRRDSKEHKTLQCSFAPVAFGQYKTFSQ
jgi:hypothetical protein